MDRRLRVSAMRVLAVVALSIFIAEFLVMIILSMFPPLPVWIEALVDSNLLVLIALPLLYIFLFRPFSGQIKERIEAEQSLIDERDRAQQYLDVAGVMLVVVGIDEKVKLINKKGLEILGRSEADVLGANWFDKFLPAKNREEVRRAFKQLEFQQKRKAEYYESITHSDRRENQGAEYYENSVLTSSGEERMVAWHNTVMLDDEGSVTAILGSGEDITLRREAEGALYEAHHELEKRVNERTRELKEANEILAKEFLEHKLADEALEETELQLTSVTQSANEAIVAADSSDTIVSWNNGARKMFGYTEEEAVGSKLTLIIPERYRDSHVQGVDRIVNTGKSKMMGRTLELSGLRKDGTEFPLELSLATWRSGKGVFFSGIMRDITERKRIEAEKENIQTQLLHSQKLEAIGRLIVGVAHDFSNIILSIKGYSSAAKKDLDKESPHYKNMEKIQKLVDRGSKLTRQLLLFGRKTPTHFTELDMNLTVDELLKMIDNLIRTDIIVTAVLDPNLWHVKGDKGNIEQLLMNLVVNANDAMPKGGELLIKTGNVEFDEVESKAIKDGQAGRYVSLSVTDTGVGMSKTVADRIFDPFFTTKGKEGSGLGLSVIYGIAHRHGGWINVESKKGQGTSFTFYMPAVEGEEKRSRAQKSELKLVGGAKRG
jgi:PAS domain S-box-containing protein